MHSSEQPATGRRKGRGQRRGRRVDAATRDAVAGLLADLPLRRDLLIEHLHRLQDTRGCLRAGDLLALADLLRIGVAEVYETATFYAHFDIREDEEPAPALAVRVCDGLSCRLQGALQLDSALRARLPPADARVLRAPCMGRCDLAPVVQVGKRHADRASAADVLALIDEGAFTPLPLVGESLDAYRARGGYRQLQALRDGALPVETVFAELEAAGLRGMGGAGFPTARKWRLVRAAPAPRYLVCNADEGEPGTFKDRVILEEQTHPFLDGLLLAAACIDADRCWIYLRDEYPAAHALLRREIAALEAAQLVEPGFIDLRRGAGAYICGEESALIESIEGKRGYPRQRPPYVAEAGLFGRPTLVNNVETLALVPTILAAGGARFGALGGEGFAGLRSYSVSGRVREPGVKQAPAGISTRQLIDDYCGGMAEGHQLLAYLPGGASGGILPASLADLPLHFGELEKHGALIGSAALIVLSDRDDLRAAVQALLEFFADESCGQCTPCRIGTEKMLALFEAPELDVSLLNELAALMRDASICGLGQAAPNPLTTALQYFPQHQLARKRDE
ncbi:MAG: NADH-quinone oxidoreductase subunit F [Candidatus Accumulibacter regalis]|jgi:NADH:ubiquinone oxidoreductase subunit F (NADH-binding)/NADH:ubiquinone oxidoreductase subunit E|uniref:NADH-quinone oxidoreductase subunit F n=1 Tax=Accumulibacter regalis TaxID=522306 RepID=A0A011RHB9_ACCRE|nr:MULTISPECIES: NADH-ubiquinone oxidoreductase-F iron-sulfur binding region domain-containing protein [unclassified Candidatus Accumulibacter]EXI90624.1 MAG: NADH-quinone oxidoreductase subunit F [Candidatus Accumulibacter regalis]MQM35423.1 NADH-quinone oxidoreductase subunit F [Candidatus Accumulibacter phosphatis]MBL8366642.1 NAD(P)H-dependent oxidoreductase subunit E [Accumulibacter sp.]MBN8513620.1 NAD(P)H-dependent oxidoreductase subunit E [Accumulibacter sp.]MBO3702058.1 NAD(P)H-depend